MPRISDPMDGLVSLQAALNDGSVRMEPCELHRDLRVLMDRPLGVPRLTYARIVNGEVQGTVVFAPVEAVEGVQCFGIGYAVAESHRGKGLATALVPKAIEELCHQLKGRGSKSFYIEAIVAQSNVPSNRLAAGLLSETPIEGTDSHSGEPIFQYLKLIE